MDTDIFVVLLVNLGNSKGEFPRSSNAYNPDHLIFLINRFKEDSRPELCYAYLDQHQFSSPWPTSLIAQVRLV